MSYTFLPHTADSKFRAKGESISKAFISSAKALISVMTSETTIKKKFSRKIVIHAPTQEMLLYEFLEELIYLLEAKSFVTATIKSLSLNKTTLKATLLGDSVKTYTFTNQVKAVTLSELKVKKGKKGYACTVVLDL